MTYKTAAFERLNTVLIDVFSLVTFRAVIHLHTIPGVLLKAGDILAPDVPTDTGNPVGLIYFQAF